MIDFFPATVIPVRIHHCPPGYLLRCHSDRQIDPDVPSLALTKSQAAQALNVSEKTIERLVARGLLKSSRALRTPRFSLKALNEFLETTSESLETKR